MENVRQILEQLFQNLIDSTPKFLTAILILVIGWIIAKIVAFLIKKILKGLKVDDLAEQLNHIDVIHKSNITIVPSTIFSKIFYYLIFLVFATAAAEKLEMQAVTSLVKNLIAYIPLLISAIIVLAIGVVLADFLKGLVLSTTKALGIPSANMIAGFVFYFVFLMTIITAIGQLGIGTEFIATNLSLIIGGGVAAFALGYGFASRATMSNFLASFYAKEKFKIGDMIAIDNSAGKIISMDSSAVTLQSEGKKIIIPLSKLISNKVEIHEKT